MCVFLTQNIMDIIFFVVLIQIIKKDECLESGYLHWQSGEVIKEGVMNTSTIKLQEKQRNYEI